MFGIGALLLNTLCIVLSIFAYDLIVGRRAFVTRKLNRVLISLLASVCAVVCMAFPVTVVPDLIFHLAPIPFLISMLYGGLLPGIITAATILVYGSLHGGFNFYISILTLGIQAVSAFFAFRRYKESRLYVKFIIGAGLVLLEDFVKTAAVFSIKPGMEQKLPFLMASLAISMGTIVLTVYLIEYLKRNYYLRAEFSQTEKLKVASELAASIAHEVRNPMTAVRGFAQLLSRDPYINEHHANALSVMISELDRAHEIISDYLDFARPQPDSNHFIDVSQQIHDVVQILTPYANSKSVSIDEASDQSLYVLGDSRGFYQALMNIIKNAIESMPNGGSVLVRARKSKRDIELEIADHGCGMDETELSRLGTPFYSTKSNGTGLGLTSVYQCVQSMNGQIRVRSERDQGTTFYIVLPPSDHGKVIPNPHHSA